MKQKKHSAKEKGKSYQKAMDSLEVPKLLKSNLFHLETNGNEEMILDGCLAVLDYGDTFIKLRTKQWTLCFAGENLCLKSYANSEAVLEGKILSISFEE